MIAALIVGAILSPGAAPPDHSHGPTPGMSAAHKDALARYGAAVWNLHRERLLTAVKQFEAAAKAEPEATAPRKELIELYAQLGREPQAIRLGRKLLEKDPDDADSAALSRDSSSTPARPGKPSASRSSPSPAGHSPTRPQRPCGSTATSRRSARRRTSRHRRGCTHESG